MTHGAGGTDPLLHLSLAFFPYRMIYRVMCLSSVLSKYLNLNTTISIYTYTVFTFAEKDWGSNYLMPAGYK